ncbi:hypothetical protein [Pseudomonas phage vB_Pae_HMKU_23]|nr:hypothetical protein [Pseudomonas phage vB_Pae_HMKU_23]
MSASCKLRTMKWRQPLTTSSAPGYHYQVPLVPLDPRGRLPPTLTDATVDQASYPSWLSYVY